jgi:hypothetical protein
VAVRRGGGGRIAVIEEVEVLDHVLDDLWVVASLRAISTIGYRSQLNNTRLSFLLLVSDNAP